MHPNESVVDGGQKYDNYPEKEGNDGFLFVGLFWVFWAIKYESGK